MRIFDEDVEQATRSITLFLTQAEAHELADALLSMPCADPMWHQHVNDVDYTREITLCSFESRSMDVLHAKYHAMLRDEP